jgi:hypothetical protein
MKIPGKLFLVLTFGVASCLNRGLVDSMKKAKSIAKQIRKDGGDPRIFVCEIIK